MTLSLFHLLTVYSSLFSLPPAFAHTGTTFLYKPSKVSHRNVPTCTPSSANSSFIDDVPSIHSAIHQCGDGGVIVLPEGVQYALNTPLSFDGCNGCDFRIEGTLKASNNVTFWNTTTSREMIWVNKISGVKIRSLTGKGIIDGNGQTSYDEFGKFGNIRRPVVLSLDGTVDATLANLKIINPPVAFINIGHNCSRVQVSNMFMSAVSTSQYAPRNTDGFDIGSSSYIDLENITVINQDDCIAFKPAADHITVWNITCDGSHGLSIGSLAKYAGNVDTVTNVLVKNAVMKNSSKAVGVKIYPGGPTYGTAVIRNVTWENVYVDNCDAGFQFEACYEPPNKNRTYCELNPSASIVQDVIVRNMTGTVNDRYKGVTGYVYCPSEGDNCRVQVPGYGVRSTSPNSKLLCDNISPEILGTTCVETNPY